MSIESSELHELGRQHRQLGVGFAMEGIRLLTVLNGGALAGIPVATKVMATMEIPFGALVVSAGGFVAGLVAIAVACLFAFLAQDVLAIAYHTRALGELDEEDRKQSDRHGVYRWIAIGAAVFSLVVFCASCVVLVASAHDKWQGIWGPFDPNLVNRYIAPGSDADAL